MAEVVIDGVTYVPKSPSGEVRIVVLQRGWVMVGRYREEGTSVVLDPALNIRRWGTTGKGLGALRSGPRPETVLDEAGRVEAHQLTVLFTIACEEAAWASRL